LAVVGRYELVLEDIGLPCDDGLDFRTRRLAWNGDVASSSLACQRRLRFREDLVKRLSGDRQRPERDLIGSGFHQRREVVL
jgi:hypothetical protein